MQTYFLIPYGASVSPTTQQCHSCAQQGPFMGRLSTACLAAHTHLIQSVPVAWSQAIQAHTRAHACAHTHTPWLIHKEPLCISFINRREKYEHPFGSVGKQGNLRENSCSLAGFKRENENPSVPHSLRATQQF